MLVSSRLSTQSQVTLPKAVREAIGAEPGDVIGYEIRGNVVTIRRLQPFDAVYHASVSEGLEEWASVEDDAAFRDL
jgi:bifunctional DNA-binding transcriptional regulator/antitoxin component of YhaV-PrlF toxin-antitoxin module